LPFSPITRCDTGGNCSFDVEEKKICFRTSSCPVVGASRPRDTAHIFLLSILSVKFTESL
jgi:hypothetical protein